jgi:hypothetical protein
MHENYNNNVFINCPFDNEFTLNLHAIIFTVYHCGFFPNSALSDDNALDNRLSKIEKLVENSKYGIHDISRTELNNQGFPRFNMPFELGLFFGAKRFGNKQRNKNALIFERVKFSYQSYLSDLNGIDTKAHNNDTSLIIQGIRDWLKTASKRTSIPGHITIIKNFEYFQKQLPSISENLGLDAAGLTYNDLCLIIEEFLKSIMS